MQEFTLESLYEDGKINIYPKKNTVDLKNHLSKKMQKIDKKTEKAIVQIAMDLLKKKQEASKSKPSKEAAVEWLYCIWYQLFKKYIRDHFSSIISYNLVADLAMRTLLSSILDMIKFILWALSSKGR